MQLKNMLVKLFLSVLKNAPAYLGVIDVRFVVAPLIFLQESEFGVMVSTRDGASVVRFESLAPTNKIYKNKLKLNAYETKTLKCVCFLRKLV